MEEGLQKLARAMGVVVGAAIIVGVTGLILVALFGSIKLLIGLMWV